MLSPEKLSGTPEEYPEKEGVRLSKVELKGGEAEQFFNQALDLEDALEKTKEETARLSNSKERSAFKHQKEAELFGEMSQEEAAKILKAVSTRASETKETPPYIFGIGSLEKEGYSISTEEDPHLFNTYDSANGVLQWIDDEGVRWVVPYSYTTTYLVGHLGLKEKWQWVPHSSNGGTWMSYHNAFWRGIQLQELKRKLRREGPMAESVREGIEKEITRTKESEYGPENYKKLIERIKKERKKRGR